MSKKEIETKISKYLRKASRLKVTKLKLEKTNELLEIIQRLYTHASEIVNGKTPQEGIDKNTLKAYIDICHVYKIKFQMDALFEGIKRDIKALDQDSSQMNQEMFDSFIQRLYVILDIDLTHPEAQGLIQALSDKYTQHAENSSFSGIYPDITNYQSPDLSIEIECNSADIAQSSKLQPIYKSYQKKSSNAEEAPEDPDSTYQFQFYLKQLHDFEVFHEELHMKPTYRIRVNNQEIDEKSFSEWFQCYKRFMRANTPQYCYGASPFTFNFFGCHKLYMSDVAKQLEKCWFHYGILDQESGLFLVNLKHITGQMHSYLGSCGFCPAMSQEKLDRGFALIPRYINPECDSQWNYFYNEGKKIGVIPAGNDIAISTQNPDPDKGESSLLFEIGSTPYIDHVLRYLQSQTAANVEETVYKSVSHCMECGAPYKPHTMTCSKCKKDFWKYAQKNPESVVTKLKYTREVDLDASKEKKGWRTKHTIVERRSKKTKADVSFDQLWRDPQVQEMLSEEQESAHQQQPTAGKKEDAPASREERIFADANTPSAPSLHPRRQSPSQGRFDFHSKLRSLMSKRYRERKAIEHAFGDPQQIIPSVQSEEGKAKNSRRYEETSVPHKEERKPHPEPSTSQAQTSSEHEENDVYTGNAELLDAVKKLKPRQRSELSKRGVVRVIYYATMDKEICPLCGYLDGMVMDPDDPATDIFSPPLYPGCTCRREYVLKTEKPANWPEVTFRFPPKNLLGYLEK